jgi:hypothetical protein
MARISGSYKASHIATIAAAITLIDAQLTTENTRMIALGGAATEIIGTITLTVKAENPTEDSYDHKITTTLNCAALANTATQTAALSTYATAVETQSPYTTVQEVDITMNTVMSND